MNHVSVKYTDGREFTVATTPGDMVRLERQFNVAASNLEHEAKMEHVMFLAYSALKRTGHESGDFDTFLDNVADFDADPKEQQN